MAGREPAPVARGELDGSGAAPWSRCRLLQVFLTLTLVVAFPVIAVQLIDGARSGPGTPAGRLIADLVFLGVIVSLLFVNRSGRTELASWVFCAALVINGSEFFPLAELDRVLVLYALPIALAAVLLRPVAAFHLLGLSVADYFIAYLRHEGDAPLNWLSLLILAGVAVVSWLAARRAAWFEEAEEMYRVELDVAAGELDELQAQAEALHAELAAERDAAGPAGEVPTAPDGSSLRPVDVTPRGARDGRPGGGQAL